jgi:hypothetical protein
MTEPACQWCAWQGYQVTDTRDPDARQGFGGIMVDADGRDRQATDALNQRAVSDDTATVTRQCIGRTACARDGAGDGQPRPLQPCVQITAQLDLTPKQVRDTSDVGNQPIRAIACDHWRIATCPPTQGRQSSRLARKIRRACCYIRADGARICQWHTSTQTPRLGSRVQTMQVIGLA